MATATKVTVVGTGKLPSGDKILHVKNEKYDASIRVTHKDGSNFFLGKKANLILEDGVPVLIDQSQIKKLLNLTVEKPVSKKALTVEDMELPE